MCVSVPAVSLNVRDVSPAVILLAAPVCTPIGDLDLKSGTLTTFAPHVNDPVLPQSADALRRLNRAS